MNDELKITGKYKVSKVTGKTSAKVFKNTKVGDIISFSLTLRHLGTNRGQTYATYIVVENERTGETDYKSMNELSNQTRYFEFEEI